jgi:hypothetical protein
MRLTASSSNTVTLLETDHVVHQVGGDPRSRRSEGVTQSDRSSENVGLFVVESELLLAREPLSGECLVDCREGSVGSFWDDPDRDSLSKTWRRLY